MLPQFSIGSMTINTYYLMCAIASLSIPLVILLRRKHYGMNVWQTLLFSFSAILSGFAGCNLLYWMENTDELFRFGWSFRGFSFFGSILFAPFLLMLFALILNIPVGNAMDLLGLGLPPFLAIVRIGCFCGGCCGGITYHFAEGARFVVPTQLIECAFDFLIFFLLLRMENRQKCEGYHFPVFLVSYGALRFTVEFFRDTQKNLLGFSNGQVYSVLIFLVGGAILLFNRRKIVDAHRQQEEEAFLLAKEESAARRAARARYKKNH